MKLKLISNILLMMLSVLFLSKETTLAASNAVSSAAGQGHSLILKSDGTVWAWGDNSYGQLGDGAPAVKANVPFKVKGITNVSRIAAGSNHSVALKADGTVWSWGLNSSGELGNSGSGNSSKPVQAVGLTDVTEIAAGSAYSLALKKDGTVWVWGRLYGYGSTTIKFPIPVHSSLTDVTAISAGRAHCLALKKDGTVWAWGENGYGQLGIDSGAAVSSLTKTKGLSNIVSVAAGDSHSLALDVNGKVYAWGDGGKGQIGDGSVYNRLAPVNVPGLTEIDEIASGPNARHSFALKRDGTVYAWGSNDRGQLGDGTTTNSNKPVKVKITP
ncbi:regulator [Brevibacillus fortis]|uniref:Regulator n=2 Tax=Brevibacillus fortis TaxID=2126352 RepID=A0A2P7V7I5_9BACL|nr:regulator [Brevibacillus fortis]